jgi:hypothetical protein
MITSVACVDIFTFRENQIYIFVYTGGLASCIILINNTMYVHIDSAVLAHEHDGQLSGVPC